MEDEDIFRRNLFTGTPAYLRWSLRGPLNVHCELTPPLGCENLPPALRSHTVMGPLLLTAPPNVLPSGSETGPAVKCNQGQAICVKAHLQSRSALAHSQAAGFHTQDPHSCQFASVSGEIQHGYAPRRSQTDPGIPRKPKQPGPECKVD